MDKAIELDPLSFAIRSTSARLYFNRGRFQETLAENETANKLQTDHRLTQGLDLGIYYYLKEVDKAFDVLWKNRQFQPQKYNLDSVKIIYEKSGLTGVFNYIIRIKEKRGEYNLLTRSYAMMGNNDKALDFLEKAFESGTISVSFSYNIQFVNLHDQPRYIAILKKMGLHKYWSDSNKLEL